jgi:hypothetical protein
MEPEELDAYVRGRLERSAAAAVKRHLDECALCRLELRRMKRFEDIESDDELAGEADWESARFKMERAFRDRVLPTVIAARSAGSEPGFLYNVSRWLAPLAAAAAVIMLFASIEGLNPPQYGFGPMRGGAGAEYEIVLDTPVGNIADYPDKFDWHSKIESDHYTLEIFTSNLRQVYVADNLGNSDWTTPDSVKTLFERGTFYLWSVTGYRGLEREIASPNAWFRILSNE